MKINKRIIVVLASVVVFISGCNSGATSGSAPQSFSNATKVSPKLQTISDDAVFNAVTYDKVSKIFIAGGNKGLLAKSIDGIHWFQYHPLNSSYAITGLHVTDDGEIYCTDSASSLWKISDSLAGASLISIGRSGAEPLENGIARTHFAEYEVFKIGNKLSLVVRRQFPKDDTHEEISKASNLQIIYSGTNVVGIVAADSDHDSDHEIVVLKVSKVVNDEEVYEALVSTTPAVSNSFKPSIVPGISNVPGGISLSSGAHIVATTQGASSDRIVEVLDPDDVQVRWERNTQISSSISADELPTFFDIEEAGFNDDVFVAVSSVAGLEPAAILTGSIDGKVRPFRYQLPSGQTLAQRTCATGARLDENSEPVLIILGKDNKVLYSRDDRTWHVYTM